MTIEFASYSAEDNKLRLYTNGERVSDELYAKLKECGFRWAPKQELFVCPSWSPSREDLCIELAGEIEAEQTTILERAEAKAERLDALAIKRTAEASSFASAADKIAERFNGGQPILVGHHSERKARKDAQQVERLQEKAEAAANAVSYWLYRAEGVERHANYKNDPAVRARRIKTLLAELRDDQRKLNHGQICLDLWKKIDGVEDESHKSKFVQHYVGAYLKVGRTTPDDFYSKLRSEEMSEQEVIDGAISWATQIANSRFYMRRIQHTLNRLGYERFMLGETRPFDGNLTANIIKAFAREHGAFKPDCKKVEGQWELSSSIPLPMHIADGKTLNLSNGDWKALMQSCGYEVPEKKPAKPPILNFKAKAVTVNWYGVKELRQVEMTKAEYSEIYSDYRGVKLSACGQFRVKICRDPHHTGASYGAEWVTVFLTDSKAHTCPESDAIIACDQEAA